MASNNVITNLESKNKVTKHLSLSNLFFIIGYLVVAFMLKGFVNELLFIPYIIFSAGCAFWLIIPSGLNKGRTHLESLFVFFTNDKNVYRPYIPKEEGDSDE